MDARGGDEVEGGVFVRGELPSPRGDLQISVIRSILRKQSCDCSALTFIGFRVYTDSVKAMASAAPGSWVSVRDAAGNVQVYWMSDSDQLAQGVVRSVSGGPGQGRGAGESHAWPSPGTSVETNI